MGLFKKTKEVPPGIKPAPVEKQKNRKYFEVFGDTLNQLNVFKTITFFLLAVVIFQTIIIKSVLKKPPLVIRVDQLGNAEAIKDVKSLLKITPPEIFNFTQYFLHYFIENNFYTYDEDFTKAFLMMTQQCQQRANDYLSVNRITEGIKSNQTKTKLNITDIRIVKDSPEYINLKVKGTREVRSYQNSDFYKEIVFEDELSLKKVDRTDKTPWGLLVDAWNETLFKNK